MIGVIIINKDSQELIATVVDLGFSDHLAQISRINSGIGNMSAVLQIGRSLVQFQMVALEFFIDITLPITLWPWG